MILSILVAFLFYSVGYARMKSSGRGKGAKVLIHLQFAECNGDAEPASASFTVGKKEQFLVIAKSFCAKFDADIDKVIFTFGSYELTLDQTIGEQMPYASKHKKGVYVYVHKKRAVETTVADAEPKKVLLLLDFDGVLNSSPTNDPYPQTKALIEQLHACGKYDLVLLTHNEWAWHALCDWGDLDTRFKAMRMVCTHKACQLKDRPYGQRNNCRTSHKAELLQSLLDDELKDAKYEKIFFFDDFQRYLDIVCKNHPSVVPCLVDPNEGLTIQNINLAINVQAK